MSAETAVQLKKILEAAIDDDLPNRVSKEVKGILEDIERGKIKERNIAVRLALIYGALKNYIEISSTSQLLKKFRDDPTTLTPEEVGALRRIYNEVTGVWKLYNGITDGERLPNTLRKDIKLEEDIDDMRKTLSFLADGYEISNGEYKLFVEGNYIIIQPQQVFQRTRGIDTEELKRLLEATFPGAVLLPKLRLPDEWQVLEGLSAEHLHKPVKIKVKVLGVGELRARPYRFKLHSREFVRQLLPEPLPDVNIDRLKLQYNPENRFVDTIKLKVIGTGDGARKSFTAVADGETARKMAREVEEGKEYILEGIPHIVESRSLYEATLGLYVTGFISVSKEKEKRQKKEEEITDDDMGFFEQFRKLTGEEKLDILLHDFAWRIEPATDMIKKTKIAMLILAVGATRVPNGAVRRSINILVAGADWKSREIANELDKIADVQVEETIESGGNAKGKVVLTKSGESGETNFDIVLTPTLDDVISTEEVVSDFFELVELDFTTFEDYRQEVSCTRPNGLVFDMQRLKKFVRYARNIRPSFPREKRQYLARKLAERLMEDGMDREVKENAADFVRAAVRLSTALARLLLEDEVTEMDIDTAVEFVVDSYIAQRSFARKRKEKLIEEFVKRLEGRGSISREKFELMWGETAKQLGFGFEVIEEFLAEAKRNDLVREKSKGRGRGKFVYFKDGFIEELRQYLISRVE
ncbi:hypothetical protein [Thermococcus sp. MAR1]|uniref:hypothetical protein n=1 Tax=Thermococcus sp. MAR1 TaxID=1638263 RepID=UPI00143AECD1|nr:hypothetical protein [Thermococcus sp. MAR1]NJE09348.1 hypothetical protein [Thermococcus sp. MAR1]